MAIEFKNYLNSRKDTGNYTRAGLPTGLSPEQIKTVLGYSNDKVFLNRANPSLIKNKKIKDYYDSGLYSTKTFSKKTQSYISGAQDILNKSYNGILFESGWFDEISVYNGQRVILRLGSSLFFEKNRLPYSDGKTSGVYIDEVWSGYNVDFDNNKVLGGFIISGLDNVSNSGSGTSLIYPYRNFYEIFEHEKTQIGDMGNYAFRSGGYYPGQKIGYNAIYFQSGLNKNNVLNKNPQFLFVPNPIWAKSKENENIKNLGYYDLNIPRNYPNPSKEKENVIRWNVFIYTGLLNYKVVPFDPVEVSSYVKSAANAGVITKKIQSKDKISPVTQLQTINMTGVYPEIYTKRFSIFNPSPYPIAVYCGTSSPAISLEYPESFVNNTNFIWTEETGYHPEFAIDKVALLSSRSSANLNVKVNSALLGAGNVQEKIYVHYITGIKDPLSTPNDTYSIDGNPSVEFKANGLMNTIRKKEAVSGFASLTKTITLDVQSVENNSKITFDDKYFETRSGAYYYPVQDVNKPFELVSSGIKNKLNKTFGLTFYSTGTNMWEDYETKTDLLNKINKSGPYHPTTGIFKDIKNIYPLIQGEAYVSLFSSPEWITPKDSNITLKWISGYSGLFASPKGFNPVTGALQGDMFFDFNLKDILPSDQNLSGYNLIVETRNGQAPIIRNQNQDFDLVDLNSENIPVCLDRSKEYRFLQINNTDVQKLKFSATDKLFYKVYEPEYNNATNKNYRLVRLKLTDETPDEIVWETNSSISGKFKVVGSINNNRAKDSSSGVYDIYNFSNRLEYTNYNGFIKEDKYFVFITATGSGLEPIVNPKLKLSKDKSYIFNYLTMSGITGASDFNFWKKKISGPNVGSITPFNFPNSSTGANVVVATYSGVPIYTRTVSFDIPSNFTSSDEIYLGFSDRTSLVPINFYNESISESDVLLSGSNNFSQVSAPIFSGDLTFATSEKTINIPVLISGQAGQTFYSGRA